MPTATEIPAQGACTQLLMNRTFEMGSLAYWLSSGVLMPRVVSDTTHSGDYSLLIGLPKVPEMPGDGWAWQWVTIPQNVTAAPWRFWYNVHSQDGDAQYDWFEAGVFDPQTMLISGGVQSTGTLGWAHAEIDLASYAGKTIALAYHVRQDGNAGSTWAFVDDVSLCVEPLAIPAPGPSASGIEGACFAEGSIPDYAPSGMPDFEMVRHGANSGDVWARDASAAAANALWWLDSLNEPGSVPPPTRSDGFDLVTSYDGANDDHAAPNVEDLIADLVTRMGTGATGTGAASVNAGLTAYLAAKGLSSQFAVTGIQLPSYATLRTAQQNNGGVILLLGFWEWQGREWKRLGGHYVTLAGAGCAGENPMLAISDPWRDNAERGFPGRVLPSQRHLHSGNPLQNAHDNAAVLSHDLYPVGSMDGAATLVGYARGIADIANFLGLNATAAPASAYQGGQIVTRIDLALLIAPPGLASAVDVQVAPTARVHGLVQHQAWPAVNFPLLVSLHEPTSQYPTYSWAITTTNASEFTTALFEPGEYVVKAKAARTLQNAATASTYLAGTTDVNLATLETGDLNNDNRIDGLDVSALSGQIAAGTYSAIPDLNHDNAVNGADLAIVWPNVGKAGDIIVAGPGIQGDRETGLAAPQVAASVPGAFLNLVPSASQSYLGQVFALSVVAQLPEDAADTVEFHLDFDPAVLQVVDAQGQFAAQIQGVGTLPLVGPNRVDNTAGRIDFCATTTDPGGKTGSFIVAKVSFKAVAESAGTWVRFTRDQWPYTEVSRQGESLLRRFAGAEILVGPPPAGRAYLPVVMGQ